MCKVSGVGQSSLDQERRDLQDEPTLERRKDEFPLLKGVDFIREWYLQEPSKKLLVPMTCLHPGALTLSLAAHP